MRLSIVSLGAALLLTASVVQEPAQAQIFGPAISGLTGDCTASGNGVVPITCTKTNGIAFATSATTDTTNAGNITSGTFSNARLATGAAAANLGYTPLNPSLNLSDLSSIPTALNNLGIGPLGRQAGATGAAAIISALGYTPANAGLLGPLATQAGATSSAAIIAGLGYAPVNPSALGTMAFQNASAVAITGGSAAGVTVAATALSTSSHIVFTSASTPTISGCGLGATIAGNDSRWTLTTGTSLGTCVVTFATPFAAAPVCVAVSNNITSLAIVSATTATTVSLGITSILSTAVIRGICAG